MLITGYHACSEFLDSTPERVKTIYISRHRKDDQTQDLHTRARKAGVTVSFVTKEFFKQERSPTQGVAAEISPAFWKDEERFLGKAEGETILLVEEVSDPHNLGSILRVAECAGISFVAITKNRTSPLNATVFKASAGAAAWLQIGLVKNVRTFLTKVKSMDYWVVGTAIEGKPFYETDLPKPLCLIMGSEGKGLKHFTRRQCDEVVSLPLMGHVTSLNVSTATAVLLYEILRRDSGESEK